MDRYGFLEFDSEAEALVAIKEMDQKEWMGKTLRLEVCLLI